MGAEQDLDEEDIAIIEQLTTGKNEHVHSYIKELLLKALPLLRSNVGGIDDLCVLTTCLYRVATCLTDKVVDAPKRAILFDLINGSPIWDTVLTTTSGSKYFIRTGLGQIRWKTKEVGWELQPLTSSIGYVRDPLVAKNFGLVHTAFADNQDFKSMSLPGVHMRVVGGQRDDRTAQWVDVEIAGISQLPEVGLIPLEYIQSMRTMPIDFKPIGPDEILRYSVHRSGSLVLPADHRSSGVIAIIENRVLST